MSLPLRPFQRIFKKVGATRVSDAAVRELKDFSEHFSNELAIKIIKLMRHADRRTVLKKDVELLDKLLKEA